MLLLALTQALAGSFELQIGPVAERGASRHVLIPMAGARLQLDRADTPFLATVEAAGGLRVVDGEVFRHQLLIVRTAAGVGLQHATGRIGIHAWAGPALVTRALNLQRGQRSGLAAQFGVRGASGMSWFLGKRLALRFQLGTLARFDRRTSFDFDGNLAVAVRW